MSRDTAKQAGEEVYPPTVKTTILFGAGASREFYRPEFTTDSLTAAIKDVGRWNRVLQRHTDLSNGANTFEPTEVLTALQEIQRLRPYAVFEDIIALLDRVSSFEHTGFPTPPGRFLLHDMLHFYKVKQRFLHSNWLDVPFLGRQLLAEAVLTHERQPDYDARCKTQRGFLAYLMSHGPINITSLNYDESLDHSTVGLDIETGFRDECFDVRPYLFARHVIAYPHGHVRFIPTQEALLLASDGTAAAERRWQGLKPSSRPSTKTWDETRFDKTFDTFLVTGLLKDFALNQNPYAAYYQRFATDLCTTDLLVIAGYSFGDEHFNRFIVNYADQDPDHRQLLIIEYDPDPIDMKAVWRPGQKVFEILRRIKAGKKRSLPFTLPNDSVDFEKATYAHNPGVEEINARGYGTLYPGIAYDKRGYQRFLEDYDAVLSAIRGVAGRKP
jgi:hypothetical protein